MKNNNKKDSQLLADKHELWRRGELRWKLRPVQLRIYSAFWSSRALKYVINSARRLGKSYVLCIIAIETALKKPGAQIRFAAPTQKALKKITIPIFRKICKDAPPDCTPAFNRQDGVFVFPNGSEIHIAGANSGHDEDLRGTEADLCLVDEAGFINDLEYLVNDILTPQLLTTGGRLILSSTPPRTPAHDFTLFVQEAELVNAYSIFTIHESGYSPEVIAQFCQEAGGPESSTWQREYLCLFVVDKDSAIIPEWTDEGMMSYSEDRPAFWHYYHLYEGMDIGVVHKNATLFGYYDFLKASIVIDAEFIISGPQMTTEKLAEGIKRTEHEVFMGKDGKARELYRRVADNNNPLLLQDLMSDHNISFAPVEKDNLDAMVNQLRLWVAAGRVIVNPKCHELIGCLKYGVWQETNRRRASRLQRQFAVSKVYGHFDALSALIYLVRCVDVNTNPVPSLEGLAHDTHFIPVTLEDTKDAEILKQIYPGMRQNND